MVEYKIHHSTYDFDSLLPEQKAREKIDRMFQDAGWTVVSRKERTDRINAMAVKEELLIGNLEADYYLYLDGKAIGVLEAKRAENPLEDDVQLQAEKYTKQIPGDIPVWCKPLPFAYISNGEVIKFKDLRKEDAEFEDVKDSKGVPCMHSPKYIVKELKAPVKSDFAMLPAVPEAKPGKLRKCQHEAISEIELSFKRGIKRCLLDLATGSGKTFTACMMSYRALNYTPVEHILYLVDRNNLGRQTEDEFNKFKLTENKKSFSSIFPVIRLKKAEEAKKSAVCISTIQRLYAVLTGQTFTDTDDDADDLNEEDKFFKDDDDLYAPVKLDGKITLPKDFFQLIIVDECHRSIYGRWQRVLEYFEDAKIIGLTATPTPQAYAFFNCKKIIDGKYEPTFQYSVEQSYSDGINVPPRIYRIKTEVTESGGDIKEKEKVFEVNRRTGEKELYVQEQKQVYTSTEVDRSVVNPTQIKKVVDEYRDAIYTKLFPNREPDWNYVPKTLFFAKTDNHAELIIKIIKESFKEKFPDEKLPENFVQKITCKAEKNPNALIDNFRKEKDFRIAVTVTLVATGTDVRPLEVLVFMRDIHSSVLYTQMKGRGCRSIDDDVLRTITPNADTKELFYLIDAVGVTESEKKIPKPHEGGEPGESLTLEKVLEKMAMGNLPDEYLEFLAEKLVFINRRTEQRHKDEFEKISKIPMDVLGSNIFKALESGTLPEYIDNQHDNNERKILVSNLIDSPEAREKLLELEKGYYKILRPGKDNLTYSGFSEKDSEEYTRQFEDYCEKHSDDIEALHILYYDEEKSITNPMLIDLRDKLMAVNPVFRDLGVIWDAYNTLSKNNKIQKNVIPLKNKTERQTLTNLIQLVRFAYGKIEGLQSINGIIGQRYGLYIGQHLGNVKRHFTDDQKEVLRIIADYVAQTGCITRQELFAYDRTLLGQAIKIYTPEKLDEELEYYSQFLLQLKAA